VAGGFKKSARRVQAEKHRLHKLFNIAKRFSQAPVLQTAISSHLSMHPQYSGRLPKRLDARHAFQGRLSKALGGRPDF
jgi:hypothetical protein